MHDGRHKVIVRGAMGIDRRCVTVGLMHNERHANLILREVRVMSPVVLMVLIILLSMVTCDEHQRVVVESLFL